MIKQFILVVLCVAIGTLMFTLDSEARQPAKNAILVVSFGTSYADTRQATIEACEQKIATTFPEYTVRRAFTSSMIIKILKERDNLLVDTPEEALQKLQQEGVTDVIVQPLHLITGEEFHEIVRVVSQYASAFGNLRLGRPLLYSVEDYVAVIEAIKKQLPPLQPNEAVVFMGHGTAHPANSAYGCLQYMFQEQGLTNVFMGTVEGYPEFEQVLKQLQAHKIQKVTLMPFMLVAGDHAQNDMAGDQADSWKTMLKKEGFSVDVYLHGLGENPAIQDIYVQHVKIAIEEQPQEYQSEALIK